MKRSINIGLSVAVTLAMAACNGRGGTEQEEDKTSRLAPREATDPVPAPPSLPDTAQTAPAEEAAPLTTMAQPLYRVTGTEPFWSLTLGKPYSTYRTMEGTSARFAYQPPQQAAGRPEEWAQLFPLGEAGWVMLRKEKSPCSDGMSDKEYAYTATLWIEGQLLDGCAEKAEDK